MKTVKELMERLNSDEAFVKEFSEEVNAKSKAGSGDAYEALISVAAEKGYEVKKSDLNLQAKTGLSDDELGKVAGGTIVVSLASLSAVVSAVSATVTINEYVSEEDD